MIQRSALQIALNRLSEPRHFIQILLGPRQVGKTTLALQLREKIIIETQYFTADDPANHNEIWLKQIWNNARLKSKELIKQGKVGEVILIIDEIQKVPNWSEIVKALWDEDTKRNIPIKILLLGSSALLIQKGLTESMVGRFEIISLTHWSFMEMEQAFNFDVEQYIFFGAYPGAAILISDLNRWRNFINDALIETTISRDIIALNRVDKPILLRRLFSLGCAYSGQVLSYQKMLGQLQDAGNATTLAHYLTLLNSAGMLQGIQKFSPAVIRQKSSSPKWQALNTALITAQTSYSLETAQLDTVFWGRLVESAVGAYLINSATAIGNKNIEIFYWREGIKEVDFVIKRGKEIVVLEVKSGGNKGSISGIHAFTKNFHPQKTLLIGQHGMSLKDFFRCTVLDLLD